MKKNINIELEDSLWKLAKLQAIAQGITLQQWITGAIQHELAGDVSKAVDREIEQRKRDMWMNQQT